MQQNLLSQKNIIIGVVILLVILGGGYYFYSSSQDSSSSVSSGSVDPSLLIPDLAAFYKAKDKINLKEKDLSFMQKPFYSNLKDHTVEIPSVKPTGRPNPFWAP